MFSFGKEKLQILRGSHAVVRQSTSHASGKACLICLAMPPPRLALAIAAMNNDIKFAVIGQLYQISGYFFHGATMCRGGLFACVYFEVVAAGDLKMS